MKNYFIRHSRLVFAMYLLLLIILSYRLAISKTIEAWNLNHELKNQLNQSAELSTQPGYLERRDTNIRMILKRYRLDSLEFRDKLVDNLSSVTTGKGARFTEIPESGGMSDQGVSMLQKVIFTGYYFDLLMLLRKAEEMERIGIVRSLAFRSLKSSKTEKNAPITMEIYFEIIKK